MKLAQRTWHLSRRGINRFIQPFSILVSQRITWHFSWLLLIESVCLIVGWYLLLSSATINPWISGLAFVVLAFLTPIGGLQVIQRLYPGWSDSLDFKYLSLFALLILWLSGASARGALGAMFHTTPSELPSAFAAASFLESGSWLSSIGIIGGLFVYVLVMVGLIFEKHYDRKVGRTSGVVRVLSLLFVMMLASIVFGSLGSIFRPEIRKVVVAQIAWDIDLLDVPEQCIPKDEQSGELSSDARDKKWKMLPAIGADGELLLIQGAVDLPEKSVWKFSSDELRRFSTFNVQRVKCDLKQVVYSDLRKFEKHWKETSRYWGIEPIAGSEYSK
ncbi:hypothetical protein [Azonexus sp.]|uniref:hypothetical protein n=1 Tax=Azonexus sp. TaxID=1872668 RepID=UPI00281CEE8D|nr:hypothetical protein [Azonexus sp.]MDR1994163.1 hypothetical protein [Azonexus sp.]